MCRIRQDIGNRNKYIIIETLYKLQKANARQIIDYLTHKKNDKISLSPRTIFRILNELQETNVIKKLKGYYFIYHDEFKYIKDSPNDFCKYFLWAIQNRSIDYEYDDLKEFINDIGSLILFYFIQSYIEETVKTGNNYKNNIKEWLNRLFSINNLLLLFLNIYTKKNRNNINSKLLYPSSYLNLNQQFELSLNDIFNNLYYDIYKTLEISIITFNYDSQIVYGNNKLKRLDYNNIRNNIKFDIKKSLYYFKFKARPCLNQSDYSLSHSWILEGTFFRLNL